MWLLTVVISVIYDLPVFTFYLIALSLIRLDAQRRQTH